MPGWVFLRHGQSEANAEGWLSGHVDTPLTSLGREQAREAGAACRAWDFTRVYSSDLIRARHTAELAIQGRGLELQVTAALRERSLGQWAKKPLKDIRSAGESHRLIDWHGSPPGGESMAQVAERVLPFFAGLKDVEGPTLVVAHGGLIRVVLGLIDGLDYAEIGPRKIANCDPLFREIPPGGFTALLKAHRTAFEAP